MEGITAKNNSSSNGWFECNVLQVRSPLLQYNIYLSYSAISHVTGLLND